MKLNTMEKLYLTMVNQAPKIELPEDLRLAALKPLERMLEMSPPPGSTSTEASKSKEMGRA